ncbi:MAG: hypothetical protein AABN34_07865 [Acidobacteriota bacterium]
MSDQAGNLMFYTDGRTVWDKNNVQMPNGTGLLGASSATQSALIVPWPNKECKKYIVFTVNEMIPKRDQTLSYSVVDMNLNGGLGDVVLTTRNTILKTAVSEKLTAVADSNGTDAWVGAHAFSQITPAVNNQFYVYHVTTSGVSLSGTYGVGSAHQNGPGTEHPSSGQMKFSPDGRLIACAVNTAFVEILNFDSTTGIVSGPPRTFNLSNAPIQDLVMVNGQVVLSPYGLEFSRLGGFLYISTIRAPSRLFQLDLQTPYTSARWTLLATGAAGSYDFGQLQLGPDNKVYVARSGKAFISVINSPGILACGFQANGPTLSSGATCQLGLPTTIAGDFSCAGLPAADACCDRMVVSPFPNDQLTQKYKTFEIYNFKSPPSPICSIDIAMNPIPFTGGWQGGDLYENSGSGLVFIPPATQFVYPYTRIPATGNISAVSNNANTPAVKFNLGIDFSHPYSGTVTLVVHHCDGSTCTLTHGPWIVGPPPPGDPWWTARVGDTRSDLVPVVLTFVGGGRSGKSARWLSVQLQNTEADIFAIEGPVLGEDQNADAKSKARLRLKSSAKRGKFALFEFSTPVGARSSDYFGTTLTLVVRTRPGTSLRPNLLLTLYDEDSNVIVSGPPQG